MWRLCYGIKYLILIIDSKFSLACHFKWNGFNRIPGMLIVYCDMKTHFSFICSEFLIQWLKDFFFRWGRFFFGILAYESDLPLKDLRTFSQNLKQLWIVLIHVNIVFHSSWLCLSILAWGKCYHCQLDSNFMPTAQLLQISKKCCMLIPEDTFIRIKWMSLLLLFVVWLLFFCLYTFFSVECY